MIKNLKAYDIIQGVRGEKGVNEKFFADIVARLSALTEAAPEIEEMDINPLLANGDDIVAVDARIKINKNAEL
jgi:acetyltransferase